MTSGECQLYSQLQVEAALPLGAKQFTLRLKPHRLQRKKSQISTDFASFSSVVRAHDGSYGMLAFARVRTQI